MKQLLTLQKPIAVDTVNLPQASYQTRLLTHVSVCGTLIALSVAIGLPNREWLHATRSSKDRDGLNTRNNVHQVRGCCVWRVQGEQKMLYKPRRARHEGHALIMNPKSDLRRKA